MSTRLHLHTAATLRPDTALPDTFLHFLITSWYIATSHHQLLPALRHPPHPAPLAAAMASSNMQRPRAPPLSEFPPLSAGSPPEQISFPPNSASIPRAHLNNGPKVQPRPQSGEFRPHQPNGKAVPAGAQGHMGPRNQGSLGGSGGFGAARSPPNTKSECALLSAPATTADARGLRLDTSHVPCKFFKQGQCQAGAACPFSHSLDVSKFETPCKYFSKVRAPNPIRRACRRQYVIGGDSRLSRATANSDKSAHYCTSCPTGGSSIEALSGVWDI